MKTFKLVTGIVLLLFSVLLFFGVIVSTLQNIAAPDSERGASSDERTGFMIGTIIAFCIFMYLVYMLYKFSLKLIQNKPLKKTTEIDEIGKEAKY